ncbi:protein phosphatase 2C domain-containing protein [Streptomyces caelestis]|uniref:protein phosphatase 2C domain-containing protein n=1 Tax=Streptomyces caelestis TaxID=36816 RepID=UPI001622FD36|nr:protein phosphatase 2C domain-containing protein [Streptomyces caelestis]
MSQQGGRPTGPEDDWWGQLYDDSTGDTGPAPAPDSLDDRFASAAGAVGDRGVPGAGAGQRAVSEPVVPAPRAGADDVMDTPRASGPSPRRAPWEPPPARPTGPMTFPTAAKRQKAERTPPAPPEVPPPPPAPPFWPSPEAARSTTAGAPPRDPTAPAAESRPGGTASAAPADPPPAPPRPADPPPTPPPPADPPPTPPPPADPPPTPPPPAGSPPTPPPPASPPDQPETGLERPAYSPRPRGYVGSRPPTYDAEPTALPLADPDDLDDLVADTVLDGARYGACTLRAVSVRGDSARYRGEPRRDSLLTARFGTGEQALLLVAMATGARATPGAHRAAAEACHWIGRAVGRSHARLVEDIRAGRRGDLKSGLHRLTDRSLGKLRASAAEQGVDPEEYAAGLRCLLLPADPECRTRVFFGAGPGGLFRLRDGEWQDIEPQVAEIRGEPVVGFGSPPSETPEGDRLTMDLGIPTPPSPYEPAPEPPREPFRFRTSVARPGDTLLVCSGGLAEPLRGEPELGDYLAERWSRPEPPGLAAFLTDAQVRVKGYADDRTAAAVWEV